MNKQRRGILLSILDRIEAIKADLESTRDDEQEFFDNMPENLRDSQKGQDAEDAIASMEEALSSLDDAFAAIETAIG
jgi:hypothetical protein